MFIKKTLLGDYINTRSSCLFWKLDHLQRTVQCNNKQRNWQYITANELYYIYIKQLKDWLVRCSMALQSSNTGYGNSCLQTTSSIVYNQLCAILLQSAYGFRFCEGSKFAISHWLGRSPLTQRWRYHAACDGTKQPFCADVPLRNYSLTHACRLQSKRMIYKIRDNIQT